MLPAKSTLFVLLVAAAVEAFSTPPGLNQYTSQNDKVVKNTRWNIPSFPLSPRSLQSTQLFSSNDTTNNGRNGKTKFGQRTATEASRFLADFRAANGEIIDPYRTLKLERSATLDDIKTRYRKLSRKLHPDAVSKTRILPGNCSNLDEVREEWEKVKFSYEILSDPKARKSYDRNSSVAEVLEDPGGAVGRAVVGGAVTAVGMGFGAMWKVGELAVKGVTSVAQPPPPPNNVQRKTQTNAIEREATAVTEKTVDTTSQARVWTLEEMRAAASTAAATGGSPNTQTIPITFDSKKSGTPIVRKEVEVKATSSRANDKVEDKGMKMITPEPLSVSATTKSKTKKERRSKVRGRGKGFSKK